MTASRTFLLSPAYAGGRRAQMLLSERAQFELARRLRDGGGGVVRRSLHLSQRIVFSRKTGLREYLRDGLRARVLVITPTRGLVPAMTPVTLADLREFAEVDIEENDPRYRNRSSAICADSLGN